MKRNPPKTKKENTLFSYFTSVKAPAKKESLSALIEKTRPNASIQQNQPLPTNSKRAKTIDLTQDDDDVLIISSQEAVIDLDLSQNSFTSSSQSSMNRLNTAEMVNNSKYNRKGWTVEAKQRGPQKSSQDMRLSQEKRPRQQFERLQLNKSRINAKPTYEWLGPNDVKPYSSNYSPFVSASDKLKDDAPRISSLFGRSDSNSSAHSFTSSGKRSWSDRDSSPSSSYGSESTGSQGWGNSALRETQRRVLPGTPRAKPRPNYANSAYAKTSNSLIKPITSKEYAPDLSQEQKQVFDMVVRDRKSLFFTGSAGTGKSVLLRTIIEKLKSVYGNQVAVTASTGIAACNINGCTLHSFSGIGIGEQSAEGLARIVENNRKASERWRETKVLIIDEISMVDADLFDKLDFVAQRIRHSSLPFGGIQMIITGDFFQLPPVNTDRNKVSKFAFEAKSWPTAINQTVLLTQVFRQKDGTFVRILNEMRLGHLSPEAIRIFRSLSRVPKGDTDFEPTELYPMRHEVDNSNSRRLNALSGEDVDFEAEDTGEASRLNQCIAPKSLKLRLHAQVMLLKNMDSELVNGSIGTIIGFVGKGGYIDKEECEQLRSPLVKRDRLASGEFDMSIPWPVVKFENERIIVIERETWGYSLPDGTNPSRRAQLPLMLAWAISIHKSQGQTLDRVRVDLGKVFEKGQAYVALSRATSLDKLQILNFDPIRVMAHPTVTNFYRTLKTMN